MTGTARLFSQSKPTQRGDVLISKGGAEARGQLERVASIRARGIAALISAAQAAGYPSVLLRSEVGAARGEPMPRAHSLVRGRRFIMCRCRRSTSTTAEAALRSDA
jgi:hypothetical protein